MRVWWSAVPCTWLVCCCQFQTGRRPTAPQEVLGTTACRLVAITRHGLHSKAGRKLPDTDARPQTCKSEDALHPQPAASTARLLCHAYCPTSELRSRHATPSAAAPLASAGETATLPASPGSAGSSASSGSAASSSWLRHRWLSSAPSCPAALVVWGLTLCVYLLIGSSLSAGCGQTTFTHAAPRAKQGDD